MPDVLKMLITPAALIVGALVGTRRMGLDPRTGLGIQWPSGDSKEGRLRSGSLLLPVAFHVLGNSVAVVQRLH